MHQLTRSLRQQSYFGLYLKALGQLIERQIFGGSLSTGTGKDTMSLVSVSEWCLRILEVTDSETLSDSSVRDAWSHLIRCFGATVDALLSQRNVRRKLKVSLQKRLRALMKQNMALAEMILDMGLRASKDVDASLIVLLGVATQTEACSSDERLQDVAAYYYKTFMNSRTRVPEHQLETFNPVLSRMSQQLVQSTLNSNVDKLFLRSPEVIVTVLKWVVKSVSFDPSEIAASWTDGLVSQIKSNNDQLRQDTLQLFRTLLKHVMDERLLKSILASLSSALGDRSVSVPARQSILDVIGCFPSLAAEDVTKQLLSVLEKESTDAIIISALAYLKPSHAEQARLEKVIIAGLKSEKSPAIRTAYLKHLPQMSSGSSEEMIKLLVGIVNKMESLPLTASAQDGYLALTAVCHLNQHLKSAEVEKVIAAASSSSSFLLSSKRFGKLTANDEIMAFADAVKNVLQSCKSKIVEETWDATSTALIGLCVNASKQALFAHVRTVLESLLRTCSPDDDYFGLVCINMMEDQLESLSAKFNPETIDLTMKMRLQKILGTLMAFPEAWFETNLPVIEWRLINLLLSSSFPIVSLQPAYFSWPDLVNRISVLSGKVAPSHLVDFNFQACFDLIFGDRGLDSSSPHRRAAASTALSSLAFVSPNVVIPPILERASASLQDLNWPDLSADSVKIWKTRAGVLCFDVIKKDTTANVGGTATEKWERQLRAELEAKKQQQRKLSKAEQEAVNAALKQEAKVRADVEKLYSVLDNWTIALRYLVLGNSAACQRYLPRLLEFIFDLLERIRAINDEAVEIGFDIPTRIFEVLCLVKACLPEKLQALAVSAVASVFRHRKYPGLLSDYSKAGLVDQTKRVIDGLMYFLSDETTVEAHTLPGEVFSFFLPVFEDVNEKARGKDNEDPYVVMLDGVSDALSMHAELGADEGISRTRVLTLMIDLIASYPKFAQKLQGCLVKFAAAMGETVKSREIELLLDGLMMEQSVVRLACLQALEYIDITEEVASTFATRIWIISFDSDETNASVAKQLWELNEMEIGPGYRSFLVPLLVHEVANVRASSARALAEAMKLHPSTRTETLHAVYGEYVEQVKPPTPKYDNYGMVVPESLEKPDNWSARVSLGDAIEYCAPNMESNDMVDFFAFMISAPASLGDQNEDVRQKMLSAAKSVINLHGKENLGLILEKLNGYLDSPAPDSQTHDRVREAVVVMLGTAAKHLDASDTRVPEVIEKLIKTLSTRSETVQSAVADCLAPLIKMSKSSAPPLVEELFQQATNNSSFAVRRGSAYGVAGIVKGYGLAMLKEAKIIDQLKTAIEDKKSLERRQGAVFVIETLALMLGRLFEPYVMQILPLLLVAFSDASSDIRNATSDASRIIMSGLSAHCVKLVLPSVLSGLDDTRWRTKVGSVEMLGSMAYLAPKQLAVSLPTIVPKLIDVLTDSHKEVQKAAKLALENFISIISNPEIKHLAPSLMKALADPTKFTDTALNALMQTKFAHYIDGPSLALVMPIIDRGLKERSTDTKKTASHILGSISSLVEKKDLTTYLPVTVPLLKQVLIDPVPEARAVTAKALGTLVVKLGEESFPSLVPELIETLKSDASRVDREGAAQGLAEILSGLGVGRLEPLMPEITANTMSAKPYVREGFLILLVFLPSTFGDAFQPFLGQMTPCVLRGLADEFEYVRDASMKAGQAIINRFARKAVDLLLPELEKGLFDDNWRIRLSSVQLLGDLLYKIAGISGRVFSAGDEDGEGTETGRKALVQILGADRYRAILAAIYVVRADSNASVRQSSVYVWKAIVVNTPKTLKEILSAMMQIIVEGLASDSTGKRQVCATTLGDIVHKLGDQVIGEAMPILKQNLSSPSDHSRQGACIGMVEILSTSSKSLLEPHMDDFIAAIRGSLIDATPQVRESAARAFDALYNLLGNKAIDEIVPSLLAGLKADEKNDTGNPALEALKEIMTVRSNLLPILIPSLVAQPISAFHARALTSLFSIAGASAITRKVSYILESLMDGLESAQDPESVRGAIRALVSAIDTPEGLHHLMIYLFERVKPDMAPEKRAAACVTLQIYYETSAKGTLTSYTTDWIRLLFGLLDDALAGGMNVVRSAWGALSALVAQIKKEDLDTYVGPTRRALQSLIHDVQARQQSQSGSMTIAGLCLPKGIGCVLPIFLQGLMYGNTDAREQSARGIGDLIEYACAESIQPYVIPITGPLIRIVGDKFAPGIKEAILDDLKRLLSKVPQQLKPFMPQLQRTLIKALSDPHAIVRKKAALVLGVFIGHVSMFDALVRELEKGIREEEASVKQAMLSALWQVMDHGFQVNKLSEATLNSVEKVLVEGGYWKSGQDELRVSAAMCLALYCSRVSKEKARRILVNRVMQEVKESVDALVGGLLVLDAMLSEKAVVSDMLQEVSQLVMMGLHHGKDLAVATSVRVIGRLAVLHGGDVDVVKPLLEGVVEQLKSESSDARREALVCLAYVARYSADVVSGTMEDEIIDQMMTCVKDRNIPVKLAAEKALMMVLRLDRDESRLQMFVDRGTGTSRALADYHRRILSKLMVKEREVGENKEEMFAMFGRVTPLE